MAQLSWTFKMTLKIDLWKLKCDRRFGKKNRSLLCEGFSCFFVYYVLWLLRAACLDSVLVLCSLFIKLKWRDMMSSTYCLKNHYPPSLLEKKEKKKKLNKKKKFLFIKFSLNIFRLYLVDLFRRILNARFWKQSVLPH